MIERVLIVDDEPLAVQLLQRKLLQLNAHLDIRTETDPIKAVEIINTWLPHLLFLDISMPEISGFDLLDQLEENERNFVLIFCTAHNEYAIKAFEKSALDYLVKPVEPERLAAALEKAQRAVNGSWIEVYREGTSSMRKVVCTCGNKKQWLDVMEIPWFSSENHETVVHDKYGNEHFCSLSLVSLEKRLNAKQFFRCHRSHIINKKHIQGFQTSESYVFLTEYPKTPIPVSRRLKQQFKEFIELT